MATFEVRPTAAEDVRALVGRLRAVDVAEVWASSRNTPESALWLSYQQSTRRFTFFRDSCVVALYGVAPMCLLCTTGVPWLLGSDLMEKAGLYFLKHCKSELAELMNGFSMLENWVDDRNEISKRWLKWCGFHIEEPAPYGPDGLPFRRFWMRRNELCAPQR